MTFTDLEEHASKLHFMLGSKTRIKVCKIMPILIIVHAPHASLEPSFPRLCPMHVRPKLTASQAQSCSMEPVAGAAYPFSP